MSTKPLRRFSFPRPWWLVPGFTAFTLIWMWAASMESAWTRATVAAFAGLVLCVFVTFARGGSWIDIVRTRRR